MTVLLGLDLSATVAAAVAVPLDWNAGRRDVPGAGRRDAPERSATRPHARRRDERRYSALRDRACSRSHSLFLRLSHALLRVLSTIRSLAAVLKREPRIESLSTPWPRWFLGQRNRAVPAPADSREPSSSARNERSGFEDLRGEPIDGRTLTRREQPAVEQRSRRVAIDSGRISPRRMLPKVRKHVNHGVPHRAGIVECTRVKSIDPESPMTAE
jgi:hypothetical protein